MNDSKIVIKEFIKDVATMLSDYLYENCNDAGMNGENVLFIAPFIEINKKFDEIASKYGVERG